MRSGKAVLVGNSQVGRLFVSLPFAVGDLNEHI